MTVRLVCRAALVGYLVGGVAACHHAATVQPSGSGVTLEPRPPAERARDAALRNAADPLAAYRRAGFLVGVGELPLVGSLAYLAGPRPDSTLVVLALSLPSRPLTFNREGDRFHGSYDVAVEFSREGVVLRRVMTHEDVRVGSFKETTRDEESVIFQQLVELPPGPVQVSITVRDGGSTRSGHAGAAVLVPRFDDAALAPPIGILRSQSRSSRAERPQLIANPRTTYVVGRDSVALFYVEAYDSGASRRPLTLRVLVAGDEMPDAYSDTMRVVGSGTTVTAVRVAIPVSRVGFGALAVTVSPIDAGAPPAAASASAPLFITLGEGFAVASFDEMLSYLRFFTTPERLHALRDAAPPARARAWASFVAATDPDTTTRENEALRDYFARVADANTRFREETLPGWLTDRGMIFSALGEPDNRMEPGAPDAMSRGRVQVWEYQQYRVRFVFVDQTGFGHWRLTAGSEAEYRALMQRLNK